LSVCIVCISFQVTALHNIVLPPVSSKVLKYVLMTTSSFWREALGRPGFKPLRLSMLFQGSRPLYSSGDSVVSVERGDVLWGEACAAVDCSNTVKVLECLPDGHYDTPYGKILVEPLEARVEDVRRLSLGTITGVLRVRFLTPTIITNRVLLPGEAPAPPMHRLLPAPGLVVAAAFRLWNRVAPPEQRVYFRDGWDLDAAKLARIADIFMAELDYSIKPVTVVIGRDDRGRLRRARGYTGWIVYRVASKKLAKYLDKFLALANRLGIGRSRAIGLGTVRAEWIPPKTDNQSPLNTKNRDTNTHT